jgi:hypothetical protein
MMATRGLATHACRFGMLKPLLTADSLCPKAYTRAFLMRQ